MNAHDSLARSASVGMGAVGTFIMLAGVFATLRPMHRMGIAEHHLLHAGMAIGAGLLAIALAARLPSEKTEQGGWVIVAVLAPIFGLVLMWPSEYAYLMHHHWLHMLDHIGILACSWLAVYAAQAYVRGLGWPMLILMVAMDAGAAGGFGVSPGPSTLLSIPIEKITAGISQGPAGKAPATEAAVPSGVYRFDPAKGASLYSSNCAACHQATGKGLPGVFPPLQGNDAVLNANPTEQIEVILNGQHRKEIGGIKYSSVMPPFGGTLSDTEIADIVNHERSSWGNNSKQITPDQVKALRKQ